MREADNKSIFLSVVGVHVVRTSSLNDMQLFRKAASFSSLVLLSSSVSMANLSCLLATTFSSLRFLFNFTSLQSFESGQALFLVVIYFLIFSSWADLNFGQEPVLLGASVSSPSDSCVGSRGALTHFPEYFLCC